MELFVGIYCFSKQVNETSSVKTMFATGNQETVIPCSIKRETDNNIFSVRFPPTASPLLALRRFS